MKPIIGITCAASFETWGHDISASYYYVGSEYADAVYQSGGLPVLLPPRIGFAEQTEDISRLMLQLDGLFFSGGGDAKRAPGKGMPTLKEQQPVRYAIECGWLRAAYERNIPVLGICRGFQMMVEFFGGSMAEDTVRSHRQTLPGQLPSHKVSITKGSKLAQIVGTDEWAVNSFHVQHANEIPEGFIVSAIAEDGVIEGIEAANRGFFLGFQFHPELLLPDERAKLLLDYFIEEATQNKIRS